jgi:hypothetical protein
LLELPSRRQGCAGKGIWAKGALPGLSSSNIFEPAPGGRANGLNQGEEFRATPMWA